MLWFLDLLHGSQLLPVHSLQQAKAFGCFRAGDAARWLTLRSEHQRVSSFQHGMERFGQV